MYVGDTNKGFSLKSYDNYRFSYFQSLFSFLNFKLIDKNFSELEVCVVKRYMWHKFRLQNIFIFLSSFF